MSKINIKSKIEEIKENQENSFDKILSFDPQTIPSMSMDQKRDLIDEINDRRKIASRYSILFLIMGSLYSFLRNFLSLIFTIRDVELHYSVNPLIVSVPLLLTAISICTDILKPKIIMTNVILYLLFGAYLIITAPSFISIELLLALCSFAGAVLFFRLSNVSDGYFVLKEQEGYPDFFILPTKEDVNG